MTHDRVLDIDPAVGYNGNVLVGGL